MDGWRAQVLVDDHGVRVWSRNGHRLTVPELDCLPALLDGRRVRLDGELLVMAGAVGDFDALCQRMMRGPGRSRHVAGFLAFDVLEVDGADLTGRAWADRQEVLTSLNLRGACVGMVPVLHDVEQAWEQASAASWEGIVLKRSSSRWRPGERSPDWRKRKVWTRGTVYVAGFHEDHGVVDKISVATMDAGGSLTRRGVIEAPGSALRSLLGAVAASRPDKRGWRNVGPAVAITAQYRLGPSGCFREPIVVRS